MQWVFLIVSKILNFHLISFKFVCMESQIKAYMPMYVHLRQHMITYAIAFKIAQCFFHNLMIILLFIQLFVTKNPPFVANFDWTLNYDYRYTFYYNLRQPLVTFHVRFFYCISHSFLSHFTYYNLRQIYYILHQLLHFTSKSYILHTFCNLRQYRIYLYLITYKFSSLYLKFDK